MHLPFAIGDYTDFYAGIHHARNVGALFRPDNPLLPNYKYVPVGYHGRASSVRPSGVAVTRPSGQRKAPMAEVPDFGPTERLDYELELGIWIGAGNALGEPIPIGAARDHIAGFSLLNDWSARDLQAWEYQPLGPFLAKSFHTTVSPWVVTPEALAPFRMAQPPRQAGDPAPMDYLLDAGDQGEGALAIDLAVSIQSRRMVMESQAPMRVARSSARYLYWTPAQLVTHHASNGCDLRSGDLIGTGTISGPERGMCGSMIEATLGGLEPIRLPTGETRHFLEDGDTVFLSGTAWAGRYIPIGFGPCSAQIKGRT
jgi:fumarylacetoacetase